MHPSLPSWMQKPIMTCTFFKLVQDVQDLSVYICMYFYCVTVLCMLIWAYLSKRQQRLLAQEYLLLQHHLATPYLTIN